jgi:protein-L-isoaspartate(D-aspartate) O-methyltransferase
MNGQPAGTREFTAQRRELIREISGQVRDKRVLAAMNRVPREAFVPDESRSAAYENHPLPIGYDQTISQPLIIGLMTAALDLTGSEKVLEIGTGSGYQTAILAELAKTVVTVERIPALQETAKAALDELGYTNIVFHAASTTLGWKDGAPYDAIIVTAGAPRVPQELVEQLAEGGRMVIPVGPRHTTQELCLVTRRNGTAEVTELGGCRFVALIGNNAWEEQGG